MEFVQTIILALIQGITEFLPISSSGHLLLPKTVLGWQDQGLAFDVAVHLGSLIAVLAYFYRDLLKLFVGWWQTLSTRTVNPDGQLAWLLVIATIPAGVAGFIGEAFIESEFRNVTVVAIATLFFGLVLGVADYTGKRTLAITEVSLKIALVIGLAQVLALIPGTSRSGITITAGLFLGLQRDAAARFSFLLAIPIILASAALQVYQLTEQASVDWMTLIIGAGVSGVSAYACIHYFLALINRIGMLPFVIYRLVLGVGLLLFVAA